MCSYDSKRPIWDDIDTFIAYSRAHENPVPPNDIDRFICPVCDRECETIYRRRCSGEVVGCDECLISESSNEAPECYPDDSEDGGYWG